MSRYKMSSSAGCWTLSSKITYPCVRSPVLFLLQRCIHVNLYPTGSFEEAPLWPRVRLDSSHFFTLGSPRAICWWERPSNVTGRGQARFARLLDDGFTHGRGSLFAGSPLETVIEFLVYCSEWVSFVAKMEMGRSRHVYRSSWSMWDRGSDASHMWDVQSFSRSTQVPTYINRPDENEEIEINGKFRQSTENCLNCSDGIIFLIVNILPCRGYFPYRVWSSFSLSLRTMILLLLIVWHEPLEKK